MKKLLFFASVFMFLNANAQLKSFTESGVKEETVKWGVVKFGKTTMSEISYKYYVNDPNVSSDVLYINWGFLDDRFVTTNTKMELEMIDFIGKKSDLVDIGKFLLDQFNNGDPNNPQIVEIGNGKYWMSGTPKKSFGKKYLIINIGLVIKGKRMNESVVYSTNEKDLKKLFNME
jgi:hypothetical protein